MVVSLGLLWQMWILWCLQAGEFIPFPLGEAGMVALVACLHEGGISDHFGCSHLMNLNLCWCRCVPTHPHSHVDRDEHPAPATASRNPDKNNVTLGNFSVREWGGCRAPTASWEVLGFQLQPRNLPRSCDTATAAQSSSWPAKKSWSNTIYQRSLGLCPTFWITYLTDYFIPQTTG